MYQLIDQFRLYATEKRKRSGQHRPQRTAQHGRSRLTQKYIKLWCAGSSVSGHDFRGRPGVWRGAHLPPMEYSSTT